MSVDVLFCPSMIWLKLVHEATLSVRRSAISFYPQHTHTSKSMVLYQFCINDIKRVELHVALMQGKYSAGNSIV